MKDINEKIEKFNDNKNWVKNDDLRKCKDCNNHFYTFNVDKNKCEYCTFKDFELMLNQAKIDEITNNAEKILKSDCDFFEKFYILINFKKLKANFPKTVLLTWIVPLLGFEKNHLLSAQIRSFVFSILLRYDDFIVPYIIKNCDTNSFASLSNSILVLETIKSDFPYSKVFYYIALYNNKIDVLDFVERKNRIVESRLFPSQEAIISRFRNSETESENELLKLDYKFFHTLFSIENEMDTDILRIIYRDILSKYFDESWFISSNVFTVEKIKRCDIIAVFTIFLLTPSLLLDFIKSLNDWEANLLLSISFSGETINTDKVEELFGLEKLVTITSDYSRKVLLNDKYRLSALFKYDFDIYAYTMKTETRMRAYDFISDIIIENYPIPEQFLLVDDHLKNPNYEPKEHRYFSADEIVSKIHPAISFIRQGFIEYLKNSKRIKKTALQKFKKNLLIDEIYDGNSYIRSEIILTLLKDLTYVVDLKANINIRDFYKNLFSNIKFNNGLFEILMPDLTILNQHDYYIINPFSFSNLLDFLKQIKGMKRVSLYNFISFIYIKKVDISPLTRSTVYQFCRLKNSDSMFNNHQTINGSNYMSNYFFPLINGMLLVLASFGIIDISIKKNLSEMSFLSSFSLSPLGEYILFEDIKTSFNIEKKPCSITLDPDSLLIYIEGDEPHIRSEIEKISEKVVDNCYLVSKESFFKSCKSKEDFNHLIFWFNNRINKSPPENWLSFFESISKRVTPFKPVEERLIFKINNSPELINAIINTAAIKQIILKADDFHIIVKKTDYPKLKQLLAKQGFLV